MKRILTLLLLLTWCFVPTAGADDIKEPACPSGASRIGEVSQGSDNGYLEIERARVRFAGAAGTSLCEGDIVRARRGGAQIRTTQSNRVITIGAGREWRAPRPSNWIQDVLATLPLFRDFLYSEQQRASNAVTLSRRGVTFAVAGLDTSEALVAPGRRSLAVGILAPPDQEFLVLLGAPDGRTQSKILPYNEKYVRFPEFSGAPGAWTLLIKSPDTTLSGGFTVREQSDSVAPEGWNAAAPIIAGMSPLERALAYACLDIPRASFEALQRIANAPEPQEERIAAAGLLEAWSHTQEQTLCK